MFSSYKPRKQVIVPAHKASNPHEALDIAYNSTMSNPEYRSLYYLPEGDFKPRKMTTQTLAIYAPREEDEKVRVAPFCNSNGVMMENIDLTIELSPERYREYQDFHISSGVCATTFLKNMDLQLPKAFEGREKDIVAVYNYEQWRFKYETVRERARSSSFRFFVIAEHLLDGYSKLGGPAPYEISGINHETKEDAEAEAEEWMQDNPYYAHAEANVCARIVSDEGENFLTRYLREITSAQTALTFTLETVQPNAAMEGWFVDFELEYKTAVPMRV